MIIEWVSLGAHPNTPDGVISRWAAVQQDVPGDSTRLRLNVYSDHAHVWYHPPGSRDPERDEFTKLAVTNGDAVAAQSTAVAWMRNQLNGTEIHIYTRPDLKPIRVHPKTKQVMEEIGMTDYPEVLDEPEKYAGMNVVESDLVPSGGGIAFSGSERTRIEDSRFGIGGVAELMSTTSAPAWAEEFLKRHGGKYVTAYTADPEEDEVDFGTMTSWFASAIEVGRSAGQRPAEYGRPELIEQNFEELLNQMVESMRIRFDVLQRHDRELMVRETELKAREQRLVAAVDEKDAFLRGKDERLTKREASLDRMLEGLDQLRKDQDHD